MRTELHLHALPLRGRVEFWLEAAAALTCEVEIDLGQLAFGGVLQGIGIVADDYALLAFD